MPNDKHGATGKPTAAMPSTSFKAPGQSDPARGPINIRSTPPKDGVGNAAQQSATSHAQPTATVSRDNHQTSIDEAMTEALAGASTSATDSLKKPKSTKSKGGAGGGSSRKRDHHTMTNASRLANDSGGGSAMSSSTKDPAHDGDNSVHSNKFQRILPKGPGPAQVGPAGQGQGYEPLTAMNGPAQPDANPSISWGQTARGENQTPEEAIPVPFLSGQVLAWLPTSLRVKASSARSYIQSLVFHTDEWHREYSRHTVGSQLGVMKDETGLQDWDTTLRGLVEVATAAREGRQLDHRPILRNQITDWVKMRIPDPDQPHGDKQFTHEPPAVPANMQPGQNDSSSPIAIGMGPAVLGPGQVADLSNEIDSAMRMSSRNDIVRQAQNAQLRNLLTNQSQAHAQGLQELQAAHRRADEARGRETDMIFTLIKKRSGLLEKKEG